MVPPAICKFLEAAAGGDEATTLLPTVIKAPLAVAVSGGVAFELIISACIWPHIGELLIKKIENGANTREKNEKVQTTSGLFGCIPF